MTVAAIASLGDFPEGPIILCFLILPVRRFRPYNQTHFQEIMGHRSTLSD